MAVEAGPEARIFGQFPPISAEFGPKRRRFGPISVSWTISPLALTRPSAPWMRYRGGSRTLRSRTRALARTPPGRRRHGAALRSRSLFRLIARAAAVAIVARSDRSGAGLAAAEVLVACEVVLGVGGRRGEPRAVA